MAEVHKPNAAHQFVYRGRKTASRSKPVKGAITIKKPALHSINPKKRKSEFNCDEYDDSNKKRAVYSGEVHVLPRSSTVDDDYECLTLISSGSFGVVYKVREIETGEIMAMKELFNGLSTASLTEMKFLRHLARHPSVVGFKKVVVDEYGGVFVLMEHVETDLKQYILTKKEGFCEIEVKALMKRLLEGVKFLHEKGVMHRDLKPPNVLVNNDGGDLKICDFGVSAMFEKELHYSPCVGTLWYRAPELLRGIETYSTAVDMWAVGCIMAELFLKEALFRGCNESDQLDKISTILVPADEAAVAAVKRDFDLLRDKFASAEALLSEEGFDLLYGLLRYDPNERITAECALSHAWFDQQF